MSQSSKFVEPPGEDFGSREAAIEFMPALLADWLRGETECFKSQLAPMVLVKGDLAEV